MVSDGAAGALPQQLAQSSLDGELRCAGWRRCGPTVMLYTDWIAQQSGFYHGFWKSLVQISEDASDHHDDVQTG